MDNQQQPNEKPFSDKKPSKPRFNMWWIWGILLLGFVIISFFPSNPGKKTNWNEVEKMIVSNDVEKIEILNDRVVKVYLKKEALDNEKYKDVKRSNNSMLGDKMPEYYFEINKEAFNKAYDNLLVQQKTISEEAYNNAKAVVIDYEYESDSSGTILYWLFMIGFSY